MPCIHMRKMAEFLTELQKKGTLLPDEQNTYAFTNKQKFWKTMFWLEHGSLIKIKERNNGDPTISLTWYGTIFSALLNHLFRDEINAGENYTLHP